jgi:hypothetical protein
LDCLGGYRNEPGECGFGQHFAVESGELKEFFCDAVLKAVEQF